MKKEDDNMRRMKFFISWLFVISVLCIFQVGCKKVEVENTTNKSQPEVENSSTEDSILKNKDELSEQQGSHDIVLLANNVMDVSFNKGVKVESLEALQPHFPEGKLVERSIDQCFLTGVTNYYDGYTTESVVFREDEVKAIILKLDSDLKNKNIDIIGLVEIGPASLYAFYNVSDETYVSKISYKSTGDFDKEKLTWQIEDTRQILSEFDAIYKDVNTIWFDLVIDQQRYLLASNHKFQVIQSIKIPDELEIIDIFYRVEMNELVTKIIIQQASSQFEISAKYTKTQNTDIHYIHVGYELYVDGSRREVWWNNHNSFDVYYNEDMGKILRISNQSLVVEPITTLSENLGNLQVRDVFSIRDNKFQNIYLENLNGRIQDNDLRYSGDLFGGLWKLFSNGDYVYIDKKTKELVRVDHFNTILSRVKIPNDYIALILEDEQNSDMYWSIVNDGVGFIYSLDGENKSYRFAHYSYDNQEFTEFEIPPNVYPRMEDNEFYYSNQRMKKLDFTDLQFKTYYLNYGAETPNNGIVFNDIFYYSDHEAVLREADESILNNESFLPMSQLPTLVIEGREEKIADAKEYEKIKYIITMEEQRLCVDKEGRLEYKSNFPIREFDGDNKGVVYVGYGQNTKGLYYDATSDEVYQIPMEGCVDSIRLVDELIIVLSDNHVYTYDRDKLVKGSASIEKEVDLLTFIEPTGIDEFFIEKYGQKIIAYINREEIMNFPSTTLVLSKDLVLMDEIQCSYSYCYEDEMYLFAPPFYWVSYNFTSGKQEIVSLDWILGGIEGYHKGYAVINDAYEGPGTTRLEIPKYKVIENLEYESGEEPGLEEDYTVVLSIAHEAHVVLIDHKHNKVVHLAKVWDIKEYNLLENGIEFIWDDHKHFVPLPTDGVIDIVIGFIL